MKTTLRKDSGFTIIEVLVGAVTFMIGFSILVALLNSTLVKFSVKEIELAGNLAQEQMLIATALADTTSYDTTVIRSDLRFAVAKRVEVGDRLARISIAVSREKTGTELIELYNEVVLPEKQ
ncbi:MAG: hypothetical protein AB1744_06570 [Candidatus Zixiibacteriota bacterium]